jgi:hypothetical protein
MLIKMHNFFNRFQTNRAGLITFFHAKYVIEGKLYCAALVPKVKRIVILSDATNQATSLRRAVVAQ